MSLMIVSRCPASAMRRALASSGQVQDLLLPVGHVEDRHQNSFRRGSSLTGEAGLELLGDGLGDGLGLSAGEGLESGDADGVGLSGAEVAGAGEAAGGPGLTA